MKRAGLRVRVIGGFAAGALLLSASMAFAAYEATKQTLLPSRERVAIRSVRLDARIVDEGLATGDPDIVEVLQSLNTGSNRRVLLDRGGGHWYSNTADLSGTSVIPIALQDAVRQGQPAVQRIRADGVPAVVIGIPLSDGTSLYEIDSLQELNRALVVLGWVLTVVAAATAVAGAALGWYAARYVLRPLRSVLAAARGIARGDLAARLDPATEPDIAQLTTSFNDMVDQLAERIERDRRFAADVSHELRSPLQTLAASASVLDKRRQHLDERTALATGLVVEEIERFQTLVDDLLELARSDRPAQRASVDIADLIRRACETRSVSPSFTVDGVTLWHVDARRVEQILSNLLDNAERYGGGAVAVRVGSAGDDLWFIEVDDEGPGVAQDDRSAIFGRFVRGRAAGARGADDGTGLGLALVAQHAAAHGGRATVTDRPGGGARFRVELRKESP